MESQFSVETPYLFMATFCERSVLTSVCILLSTHLFYLCQLDRERSELIKERKVIYKPVKSYCTGSNDFGVVLLQDCTISTHYEFMGDHYEALRVLVRLSGISQELNPGSSSWKASHCTDPLKQYTVV
jgi:hypothetical protein